MTTRRVLGGDDSVWVEFKASGYPFRLRKELKEAGTDEAILGIIAKYITACNLPTVDGGVLTTFTSAEDLANVDEQIATDIIWKFYDFRGERIREPLTKNT